MLSSSFACTFPQFFTTENCVRFADGTDSGMAELGYVDSGTEYGADPLGKTRGSLRQSGTVTRL